MRIKCVYVARIYVGKYVNFLIFLNTSNRLTIDLDYLFSIVVYKAMPQSDFICIINIVQE